MYIRSDGYFIGSENGLVSQASVEETQTYCAVPDKLPLISNSGNVPILSPVYGQVEEFRISLLSWLFHHFV